MADFHFLRPFWLLLLLIVPVLYIVMKRQGSGDSGWSGLIPQQLLAPVMRRYGTSREKRRSRHLPLLVSVIILALALAGPTWREAPTPLKKPGDSLVIVLDLSLSMLATDLEPDRLTRAKRKIRDILAVRDGSLTGLVVYSGDAHVVAPLTDDSNTLTGMLNVLNPMIMPTQGNRADLGISRARTLLQQGAQGKSHILLITDGVAERYRKMISDDLAGTDVTLSTLATGTRDGGPIPLAKRGFIRENDEIVITRTDPSVLAQFAHSNGGSGHAITLDDSDISALKLRPDTSGSWQDSDSELTTNRWKDDGYWLLWLALPLLLLGWRRGALTALALILMPAIPQPAAAMDWDSLWQREDQRAPELIRNNPDTATDQLDSPEWRGSALYRAERFDEAASAFEEVDTPSADYNRGNALARAGKLQEALDAYNKALDGNPDMEDAIANRKLVEDLLKQQENQNRNKDQNQDQKQSPDSESDSSDDNQNQGSAEGDSGQSSDNPQNGQPDNTGTEKEQSGEPQSEKSRPEESRSDDPESGESPENSEAKAQAGEAEAGNKDAQPPAPVSETPLTQSQEQSLRRVPDNPGGLLQRKFLQQHQKRQTPSDEGDTPW